MQTSKHADLSPLPLDYAPFSSLIAELRELLRGEVHMRQDADFSKYTTLFNGNVVTPSRAVVLPLDTRDIIQILQFCTKQHLSLSVKAGGYGTAGWAINGDIVIDLRRLNDIQIEEPRADGGFVSLVDMQDPSSKGKEKIMMNKTVYSEGTSWREEDAITGKRRRSPGSDGVPSALPRDSVVAAFLGPEHSKRLDVPSPSIRRRTDKLDGASDSSSAQEPTARVLGASGISPLGTRVPHTTAGPNITDLVVSIEGAGELRKEHSEAKEKQPMPARPLSRSDSSMRSDDPFAYLSSGPSPATRRDVLFAQPTYYQSSHGPTGGFSVASSSRTAFSDPLATEPGAPVLSPGPHSLRSVATPVHAHAFVTFGAGARQKDIDIFTDSSPLPATHADGSRTSAVYHVPFAAHPVGSSVMMLGGFGFLSRLHGLSIDALVEVEMVLADGRVVIVNREEHPDLWWAIRGAGTTLGVATRYKAKAYPVSVVFAGNLIYDFRPATAASLVKHFRDCIKGAPRELYANVLFTAGPADKGSLIVIQFCYIGPREKGQEYLQALSSWTGEPCRLNEVSEKTFLAQQDSVAQILRGKAGRQWFIRSALVTSLPDEIIHKTVTEFADTPIGCTWLFELAGGAVADAQDTCLPKPQREAAFTIVALHQWELDDDDPLCVSTAEDWICKTLAPVATGGPYPAFFGRNENPERIMAAFGENWERLREIKRKYDPQNLFRNTFWPLNSDGEVVEAQEHEPPSP